MNLVVLFLVYFVDSFVLLLLTSEFPK